MPKYRKMPVVIEAERFWKNAILPDCVVEVIDEGDGYRNHYIHTLEGAMHVGDGDWIITGVEGEKYPCKHSVFVATYEAVNE